MALTSVISNTVTDPSGKVVAGAVVVVTLYTAVGVGGGFRIDDGTEVSPVTSTVTNASGVWSLALERQANINPANSYYIVQEFLPSAVGDPYSPQGVRSWLFQVGATNQALSAALVTQPPAGVATAFLTQAAGDLRYVLAPGTFAGTVSNEAATSVGNAGVLGAYSRGDHLHGMPGVAAAGLSLPGQTAAVGVGPTIAYSDHRHSREGGTLGYAQITANSGSVGATPLVIAGLGVTVNPVAGRRLRITAQGTVVSGGGAVYPTSCHLYIYQSTTTQLKEQVTVFSVGSNVGMATQVILPNVVGGSVVYNVFLSADSGTALVAAATNNPAFLLVEDIGV